MKPSSIRPRFPGLHLSARDRQFLVDRTREGRAVSARTWKRIRILELLHERWTLADVAAAVGTYPREVRRVGWRYLDRGVPDALTDDPRPKPPKLLDTRQQAAIVAMVCTPPPAGYARWTIRVTTEEAKRRGIVADVGRETVRQVLAHHYEYVRRGTANIYCIVEPKAGRHVTHATRDRKGPRFVRALQRLARRYQRATTIHLIMDNLNLHCRATVIGVLGSKQGAALWARFTPHYTPKHGSWLNPAEIEASLWSRECHGRDRVDTFEALRDRTRAWTPRADRVRRNVGAH